MSNRCVPLFAVVEAVNDDGVGRLISRGEESSRIGRIVDGRKQCCEAFLSLLGAGFHLL
jgi:hypothetical protein